MIKDYADKSWIHGKQKTLPKNKQRCKNFIPYLFFWLALALDMLFAH